MTNKNKKPTYFDLRVGDITTVETKASFVNAFEVNENTGERLNTHQISNGQEVEVLHPAKLLTILFPNKDEISGKYLRAYFAKVRGTNWENELVDAWVALECLKPVR